jgi:hypothetical protein
MQARRRRRSIADPRPGLAIVRTITMKTLTIAREQWSSFFDAFSRQHEGWLVSLEEIPGSTSGRHLEARSLPLEGASLDEDGRTLSIMLGRSPDQHLTHTIDHPSRVLVEQTDTGVDQAVRIEREDGAATRVSFRSAVRPEEVDGLPGPP